MFELNLLDLIFLTTWKTIVIRLVKALLWYLNNKSDKLEPRLLNQNGDVHRSIPSRSGLIS